MRFNTLAAAAALAIGTLGFAATGYAVPVSYQDVHDPADTIIIGPSPALPSDRYTWTHDINDDVNIGTDQILTASLSITLIDQAGNENPQVNIDLTGFVAWDANGPIPGDNVPNTGTNVTQDFIFGNLFIQTNLQSDGLLTVTMRSNGGTFGFQSATLGGLYEPNALPEPGTLALLGMGLLGLGLARRRFSAKA